MRLNEHTAIVGKRVVLVPYRREHVEVYHEWMKSPELLEATASEPLSLEEEYEMQQKWHLDDDKLTFIVLARPESSIAVTSTLTAEEVLNYKMIGDTNMFLPEGPQEDVECEIMLAEMSYRGKGLAKEILNLLLNYAQDNLSIPLDKFIVRIGLANKSSIALFDKLGFGKEKVVEVFQEVTMRFGWIEGEEDGKMTEMGRLQELKDKLWVERGETMHV